MDWVSNLLKSKVIMMKKILLFAGMMLSLYIINGCCLFDNFDNEDVICFEFDQRQCGTDEWAELVPITDTKSQREVKMIAYLLSKEIVVQEINLVINFHEAVCEACDVCPEADRFFVKVPLADQQAIEALELLNGAAVDCNDAF